MVSISIPNQMSLDCIIKVAELDIESRHKANRPPISLHCPCLCVSACLQRLPRTLDRGREPVRDLDRDLSSSVFMSVLHSCPVFT